MRVSRPVLLLLLLLPLIQPGACDVGRPSTVKLAHHIAEGGGDPYNALSASDLSRDWSAPALSPQPSVQWKQALEEGLHDSMLVRT
jgi:hypothetical protein